MCPLGKEAILRNASVASRKLSGLGRRKDDGRRSKNTYARLREEDELRQKGNPIVLVKMNCMAFPEVVVRKETSVIWEQIPNAVPSNRVVVKTIKDRTVKSIKRIGIMSAIQDFRQSIEAKVKAAGGELHVSLPSDETIAKGYEKPQVTNRYDITLYKFPYLKDYETFYGGLSSTERQRIEAPDPSEINTESDGSVIVTVKLPK